MAYRVPSRRANFGNRFMPGMTISATAKPRWVEEVLACGAADELVLYDPRSQVAVALNLSAAALWELCDGERSVEQIVAELTAAASGTPDLAADVTRALEELSTLGVIVLHEPGRADG